MPFVNPELVDGVVTSEPKHDPVTRPALHPRSDELEELLPGRVQRPGDVDWDVCRGGWVTSVDQHPTAVVSVRDGPEVATVVRWAARHGVSVSVQPVGHGATDAVDGTVLLRTSAMDLQQSATTSAAMAATLTAVRSGLAGHLSGRTHFDFLGDADPSTAFRPAALARLRHLKDQVDPQRVFRSNRPVSSRERTAVTSPTR